MSMSIPEDGTPVLQDFLYVDVPRVRSLLGQLYQGTPDKVEEITERLNRWGLGASLGVAKGEAGRQSISRNQETRSFGELHFTMFEQSAEATGFLTDISDVAADHRIWESDRIAEVAPEGSIVRIEAPSNITDGQHFSEMVGHMLESGVLKKNQAQAKTIFHMAKMMYPKGVMIRIMPCGPSKPNHGFVGTLLERSDYIGPERSALYGRYGNEARDWITVGVVARRGERRSGPVPSLPDNAASSQPGFERDKLDALVQHFSKIMESHGANESPTYPGMAIIPLAVYRPITPREDAS
ncbi:hypothetical protein RM555_19715 [Micromonospora sp. DSM 115977]|uniref:Uncharacterized protein n=2 Tax=Micromonospora reichwaldensis TaxID=3075516 RepID=A0ABU2X0C8_9ACTN|nr:hypothetical protein [Micromonospora sp. DSM 115977]